MRTERPKHALTVGQLKVLLANVDDDILVAADCCAGADGHLLEAGSSTFTYGGRSETYSLDPTVIEADVVGEVLLFNADSDYIRQVRHYDDTDEEV